MRPRRWTLRRPAKSTGALEAVVGAPEVEEDVGPVALGVLQGPEHEVELAFRAGLVAFARDDDGGADLAPHDEGGDIDVRGDDVDLVLEGPRGLERQLLPKDESPESPDGVRLRHFVVSSVRSGSAAW